MPPEALQMIRDNLEWLTPTAMVTKIQATFPNVTRLQIHTAWSEMSEGFGAETRNSFQLQRSFSKSLVKM